MYSCLNIQYTVTLSKTSPGNWVGGGSLETIQAKDNYIQENNFAQCPLTYFKVNLPAVGPKRFI